MWQKMRAKKIRSKYQRNECWTESNPGQLGIYGMALDGWCVDQVKRTCTVNNVWKSTNKLFKHHSENTKIIRKTAPTTIVVLILFFFHSWLCCDHVGWKMGWVQFGSVWFALVIKPLTHRAMLINFAFEIIF